jgi:NhaP-type Na+/H+ or K+/H+ antiporter
MKQLEYAKGFWNPYVAGIALGLVLLLTFYLMGTGLGASGAVARTSAVIAHAATPTAVEQNSYYKEFFEQLDGS